MNLSATVPASSSSTKNLTTSSDPEKLTAAGKPASKTRRNSRLDEAPNSPVKLNDVYFGGWMTARRNLSQQRRNQVLCEFSESESSSVHDNEATGDPVVDKKRAVKPAASRISVILRNPKAERRKWLHLYISSALVSYMDKVFSIARKTRDRKPADEMEHLDLNAAIWECFEYHSSSSSSSWPELWSELRFV